MFSIKRISKDDGLINSNPLIYYDVITLVYRKINGSGATNQQIKNFYQCISDNRVVILVNGRKVSFSMKEVTIFVMTKMNGTERYLKGENDFFELPIFFFHIFYPSYEASLDRIKCASISCVEEITGKKGSFVYSRHESKVVKDKFNGVRIKKEQFFLVLDSVVKSIQPSYFSCLGSIFVLK
ncbi:MAG: hypothetical protein SNF33_08220 [Candidatus Algichlamydia australiensis]|nr:hypothetical protein [Chlamydiales bacterium]